MTTKNKFKVGEISIYGNPISIYIGSEFHNIRAYYDHKKQMILR